MFAVPGEVTSALSAGSNELLRLGATPLLSPDDVLSSLGLQSPPRTLPGLEGAPALVLAAVRDGAAAIDDLVARTGIDAGRISSSAVVARARRAGRLERRSLSDDDVRTPLPSGGRGHAVDDEPSRGRETLIGPNPAATASPSTYPRGAHPREHAMGRLGSPHRRTGARGGFDGIHGQAESGCRAGEGHRRRRRSTGERPRWDAATRAKDEARELRQKRELGQAYTELGQTAYALWEQGDLTHPSVTSRAERVRTLKEQLEQEQRPIPRIRLRGEAESVSPESDGDESPSAPPS